MKIIPSTNSCEYGDHGIFRGTLNFDNPLLAGYTWPLFEARGRKPGPRLCVSAGVHVNEVSSVEAAVRLQRLFDPEAMSGSVSIIPLMNIPAHYSYNEYICPIDGKNINFTFPGNANGSFSEALCDAIVHEWTSNSDCYVDLHGGDLREVVSKFAIYQTTDDRDLDQAGRKLAMCFDAEIVVGLPKSHMDRPGRPPTGFARLGRLALMSEAGANGLLEESCIAFHVNGVLNIARTLGILETPSPEFRNARVLCDEYLWVESPVDGEFHAEIEPGARVSKGQRLGTIRDLFGDTLAVIAAPETGLMLWRLTHPSVAKGTHILAVAVEASGAGHSGMLL